MYGPRQNPAFTDPGKTMPPATNSNVKEYIDDSPINGLALQHVELEILLSMKIDYGMSFDQAVISAMAHTGYDFLFSFPPERFPLDCHRVSCIRMNGQTGEDNNYLYIYQEIEGGRVEVADVSVLGEEFHDFADSFSGVAMQIRNLDSMLDQSNTAH